MQKKRLIVTVSVNGKTAYSKISIAGYRKKIAAELEPILRKKQIEDVLNYDYPSQCNFLKRMIENFEKHPQARLFTAWANEIIKAFVYKSIYDDFLVKKGFGIENIPLPDRIEKEYQSLAEKPPRSKSIVEAIRGIVKQTEDDRCFEPTARDKGILDGQRAQLSREMAKYRAKFKNISDHVLASDSATIVPVDFFGFFKPKIENPFLREMIAIRFYFWLKKAANYRDRISLRIMTRGGKEYCYSGRLSEKTIKLMFGGDRQLSQPVKKYEDLETD